MTHFQSKRLLQELSRVRGDIAAEKLTTNRLLHQNEKLQAEVAELKKSSKTASRNYGQLKLSVLLII